MLVYSELPTATICRVARNDLEEPAFETAEEVWIPFGKRTSSRTASSARTSSGSAENETSTCAIREQAVEKLGEVQVRTASSATNNRPKGASLESKHSALPNATNSDSTRVFPSLDVVMNFEEICLDGEAKIALLTAVTYKVKGTVGIVIKMQPLTLFIFKTGQEQMLFRNQSYDHVDDIAFFIGSSRFFK